MAESATQPAELTERNARESPLLRLPGEIRNQIYDYVFSSPSGIYAFVGPPAGCKHWSPDKNIIKFQLLHVSAIAPQRVKLSNTLIPPSRFALTRVCRQVHEETALLSFSLNNFTFNSLNAFLKINTKLSGKQRGAMRSVHLQARGRDDFDVAAFVAIMGREGESFEDMVPYVEELVVEVVGNGNPNELILSGKVSLLEKWLKGLNMQKKRMELTGYWDGEKMTGWTRDDWKSEAAAWE